MTNDNDQSPSERSWVPGAVRLFSYVLPFAVAVIAAFVLASWLPAPTTVVSDALRWAAIAVAATIVLVVTDRMTRRLLPASLFPAPADVQAESKLARGAIAVVGATAAVLGIAASSTSAFTPDRLDFGSVDAFVGGDPFTDDAADQEAGGSATDPGSSASDAAGPSISPWPPSAPGPAVGVVYGQNAAPRFGTTPADERKGEVPPTTEPRKIEPVVDTEPPKTEPPKTEPPKTEPPKTEPPKTEPPKTEPPKTEPPKTEPPKTEPPKTEPPKTDPPATTSTTTTSTTTTTTTTSTTTTTLPEFESAPVSLYLDAGTLDHTESSPLLWLVDDAPPGAGLPNYDTDRNDDPGLTLQPTAAGTWAETDPAKVQRFGIGIEQPTWIKGPAQLTLYLAAEGFVVDELFVEASIYHCNADNACEKIKKRVVWFASDGGFTPVEFEYGSLDREFRTGDRLEVRIAPWTESERNLLVAFGTAAYPAMFDFVICLEG